MANTFVTSQHFVACTELWTSCNLSALRAVGEEYSLLFSKCTGRAEWEVLKWEYLGKGEELDYCNWRTVGDAGNAPIAHVLLDTLYPGKVLFSLIRTLETRNEGRRQQLT